VGQFAAHLAENIAWLKANGHPKWQAVDLNYPLKGWEQYDCVKKHLAKPEPPPQKKQEAINPVLKAIKDML
jgi:hypothetical protein